MKKGFTLIELIAVILILGFIALITVPKALDVIEDSKKESVVNSAKVYVKAVNEAIINERMNKNKIGDGTYSIASNGNICIGTLNVYQECTGDTWLNIDKKNSYPECGKITIEDGKVIASSELQYGNYSISREDQSSDYKIKKEDKCLRPTKESCFEIGDDGNITKYICSNNEVIIPKMIKNAMVNRIGAGAFGGKNLKSIIIPNEIEYIDAGAFRDNELESIVLPNNLKSIGDMAFFDNTIKGEVIIPSTVETIGYYAFGNTPSSKKNNQISKLTLSYGVKQISSGAFRRNKITSLEIPNSVTLISSQAFQENKISGHLIIPDSVIKISNDAFYRNNITKLTIGTGIEEIGKDAFNGNPYLYTATVKRNYGEVKLGGTYSLPKRVIYNDKEVTRT